MTALVAGVVRVTTASLQPVPETAKSNGSLITTPLELATVTVNRSALVLPTVTEADVGLKVTVGGKIAGASVWSIVTVPVARVVMSSAVMMQKPTSAVGVAPVAAV